MSYPLKKGVFHGVSEQKVSQMCMMKVKQLSHSYVWWPCIDNEIEKLIKEQRVSTPTQPWARVHLDFVGPFMGKNFLIAMDQVIEMTSTTTANTIRVLREIFTRYGLPKQLVSDNGLQFVSYEFCKSNGIKHYCVAPYHLASNGLAERMVQSFKQSMKKSSTDGIPFQHRLANFLSTPHATTNTPPCEWVVPLEQDWTYSDQTWGGKYCQSRLNRSKAMMSTAKIISSKKVMLSGLEISVAVLASGNRV